MSDAPARRRVAMPPPSSPPRVGKVRLGEKVDTGRTTKSGESIIRPSAVDYFRVDPTDEVTAPESAASFLEVYGEEPRALRCLLPGRRAEDVWEGAYRLYGARKLKIRCDGSECDERTATGGWETKPCLCRSRLIDGVPLWDYRDPRTGYPHNDRCKLGWTLNFFLPDVVGVGVWQITTGSEISVRRVSDWLRTMEALMGDLLLLEFTLNLVPEDVTPDGKTKEVWVLEPRAVSSTPQQLLDSGTVAKQIEAGRAPAGETVMPAPADDEPLEGEVLDDGPDDPQRSVVDAERPLGAEKPEEGSDAAAEVERRFAVLRGHGLGDSEIADASEVVARALGIQMHTWDLLDDRVFEPMQAECQRKGEVKAATSRGGKGRRDPDDQAATPAPAPEGQGTMV